jgi:hypothetical protein
MDDGINISSSTCFAVPGELCRTKYVVHGRDEVTPIICLTHNSRLTDRLRVVPPASDLADYISGIPTGEPLIVKVGTPKESRTRR